MSASISTTRRHTAQCEDWHLVCHLFAEMTDAERTDLAAVVQLMLEAIYFGMDDPSYSIAYGRRPYRKSYP